MSENTALTTTVDSKIIEQVMIVGDLSQLNADQKVSYYRSVCDSMGLNPLTQPFAYIKLNGKLTLYAKRDAADQLRKIHGISIDKPEVEITDGLVIVTVTGHDKSGRTDSDLGVVSVGNLKGDQKANAILKAITKGKRRLTLSIVGLGWLDETEVETIPNAETIDPDEIVEPEPFVFDPTYPDVDHWEELRQAAVKQLGYSHAVHVRNTLKQIFSGDAASLTMEAAWAALVEHKEAEQDDKEPEAGDDLPPGVL
jgi:hypothetical protein